MGTLSHIENQFETTVEPRILEQYKDSERWKSCLKAFIDRMQDVEDASFELAHVLDFSGDVPTGARLDWLAGLVNVKRNPGESDTDFFSRFVEILGNKNAGTPDNVIYNAAILSGDPKPQYMDEAPATLFVYTGRAPDVNGGMTDGGRQLYRRQVKKLAPCGVLGLPGAAIQFADGSYMGDANGKLILAIADDSTIASYLLGEDGSFLTDEDGNRLLSE